MSVKWWHNIIPIKAKQDKVNTSLIEFHTLGKKCCTWRSFITKPPLRNHCRICAHPYDIQWEWLLKSIYNILQALHKHLKSVFLLNHHDPLLMQHLLLFFQTHILIQYLHQAQHSLWQLKKNQNLNKRQRMIHMQ